MEDHCKVKYLVSLLRHYKDKSVLVFCETYRVVARLRLILKELGIKAVELHGKMRQEKRVKTIASFKDENKKVLIATGVASRGLDIPCIDIVILYDVPENLESYVHRVGRTARAGREGTAISFVTPNTKEAFIDMEEDLQNVMPEGFRVETFDRKDIDLADQATVNSIEDKVKRELKAMEKEEKEKEKEKRGAKRKRD